MADAADRPWLDREDWRKRVIVHGSSVSIFYLVLAYVFFGGLGLAFIWGVFAPDPDTPGALRIELLMWAGVMVFVVSGLTYWWLRHRRYGISVCRLLTLPGVVGGWFKADVICALPPDPAEPVIVRMKYIEQGRSSHEIWRMENKLTVPVSAGKRSVVRVRLLVPLHPIESLQKQWSGATTAWVLEIVKKTAGVDFLAAFNVPIYNTPDAPASEQQAD